MDHVSRPSTPPTEVSSTFSSPVFAPVDTQEILRRRQQSDQASIEIGKRMLKGWAMLADECPNSECFGIPLVRPPKSGGERDPRKASPSVCEVDSTCNLHPDRNASSVILSGSITQMVVVSFDNSLVNPRRLQSQVLLITRTLSKPRIPAPPILRIPDHMRRRRWYSLHMMSSFLTALIHDLA